MRKFIDESRALVVRSDQCVHGPNIEGKFALKATGWMTNSAILAEKLGAQRCPNTQAEKIHEHDWLIGAAAAASQVYSPSLVKSILLGIRAQLVHDGLFQRGSSGISMWGQDILEGRFGTPTVVSFEDLVEN